MLVILIEEIYYFIDIPHTFRNTIGLYSTNTDGY